VQAILASVGGVGLQVAADAGGMALVLVRVLRRLLPPRLDVPELFRSLKAYGEDSLVIVVATAGFTGMIMVVQAATYVESYGVSSLVGWACGFTTFREVGPMLIGLMFSGRVGANHTSELATMRVTEQLDALRVLAIDVYEALILPRTVSMIIAMAALVIFGDLVAVLSGALCARLMLGVEYGAFFRSLFERLGPEDLLVGIGKALAYGLVIAVVSTHFGMTARGGSAGVGRAVNAQVVGCAVTLFLVDYLMTSVVR
jgi:phospholipid/cholesterol/gamma-HCH transport system permease protein